MGDGSSTLELEAPNLIGRSLRRWLHYVLIYVSLLTNLEEVIKACPKCESDQLKKVSLVYEEGTGVSIGFGVTAHGSVGIGGGVTTSALALRCAPPKEKNNTISRKTGLAMIFWLIPFLIANSQVESISAIEGFWKAWFVIGLAITTRYFFKDSIVSQRVHADEMDEYNKKYICTRCGNFCRPLD